MKHPLRILIGVLATVGFFSLCTLVATPALGRSQEKEEKHAHRKPPVANINPVTAMNIASSKVGGTAKMALFEFDDGQWIYGVVVVRKHKLMEVEIDAATGNVLETENVNPSSEAKELQGELTQISKSSD